MKLAFVNISPDVRTLGALNVATFLRRHGYPSTFVYCLNAYDAPASAATISGVAAFLRSCAPDVVCISLTTFYYRVAAQLTAEVRVALPSALVVWGGIHPTIKPRECLAHADVVCIGEGEEPLLDLVRRLEGGQGFQDVENLWVKVEDRIQENPIRRLCANLDTRPFPEIDWQRTYITASGEVVPLDRERYALNRPKQSTVYEVMASRGCPWSCAYCCNSTYHRIYQGKGKLLRFRSVEHVIAELEYVKKTFPEVKAINFEDDAFGAAPHDYLRRFGEAYRARVALPFHIRVIPAAIRESKIKLLKEAGLVGAVMGLQGSDAMNQTVYERPTNAKQFVEVALMLHRNKVVGRYDAIIDNPYSCEEDEVEAIRTFMAVPKPYHLYVYSLAFFPHTRLTERAMRDGMYRESAAGYDHVYGGDAHRYPVLAMLLKLTPYTPRLLVSAFLAIRKSPLGARVIRAYYRWVFEPERRVIQYLTGDARRLLLLRRILMRA